MFIEPLRSEVDRLRAELLALKHPPSKEELDWAITDPSTFKFWFYGNQEDEDYEAFDGWDTNYHRDYFHACHELKSAEAKEYSSLMAHA